MEKNRRKPVAPRRRGEEFNFDEKFAQKTRKFGISNTETRRKSNFRWFTLINADQIGAMGWNQRLSAESAASLGLCLVKRIYGLRPPVVLNPGRKHCLDPGNLKSPLCELHCMASRPTAEIEQAASTALGQVHDAADLLLGGSKPLRRKHEGIKILAKILRSQTIP